MNRASIIAAAFALWTVLAFIAGWQVRDGSADTAVAKDATKQQAARADQAEGARATDHANARTGAATQRMRAERHASTESNFRIIDKRAAEYAQANPDPAGCDLDGDGLRAWREANAGAVFDGPGPVHPGRPAGR